MSVERYVRNNKGNQLITNYHGYEDAAVVPTVKIIIIGNSGVGKSKLLLCFIEDNFDAEESETIATIGVDYKVKELTTMDGSTVKLAIWDTAGQERHRSLTSSPYRDALGVLLVFDVNEYASFHSLQSWLEEFERYSTEDNVVKVIVGNKIDLDCREVRREDALDFAKKRRCLYVEASAKTKVGVEDAFLVLANMITQLPGSLKSSDSDIIRVHGNYEAPESCWESFWNSICDLV